MVISDFNIICLEQSAPKLITYGGIGVDVIASKDGYGCHWMVLNNSNGVWYQFYPLEREKTGRYDDEFFDLTVINTNYMAVPYDNHLAALKKIVNSYLSLSPVHEILVLIRLDEHGESNDISEITAENFASYLSAGKLQFNKIYRVVR